MQTNRSILRLLILLFFVFARLGAQAQLMNHYWSQSYNSISSLLSGAVVAGGAGSSAIYYNPATISELTQGTNISLAASFLTLNQYTFKNALGDGKDISSTNFFVQPQFFSMSFNAPEKKLSFEVATFTRVRERLSFNYGHSAFNDFIVNNTTQERYTTAYHYENDYDDSWLGIGGAYLISKEMSVGLSILFSSSTLNYFYNIDALLNPVIDSVAGYSGDSSHWFAENNYVERIKFTNVRMILKAGFAYQHNNWSFGLNFTIPTFNIFTTGREVERMQKELYGTVINEETNPDYFIYDIQEGTAVKANFKLPFSIALGVKYNLARKQQQFYATIEYFNGIQPYKMIDATVNERITAKPVYDQLPNKDWLSFAYGASPILNIAIGYQWKIKPKTLFLMGLRTDFNNVKKLDAKELSTYPMIKTTDYDIYHATGGIQFHFKTHLLVAGTQLSFGYQKDQKQIANFGDFSEIDTRSTLPLFGERQNTMDTYYFSISLFLGATLNFQKKEKNPLD